MPNTHNPHGHHHGHHHTEHRVPKVLFILKKRNDSGGWCTYSEYPTASGLFNSARFVVDMLHKHGIEAKLVSVNDAHCIDREVHHYRPTHVIVEAIWVPPAKFAALSVLHPRVHWVVRIHSELPFLGNEGMAIKWLVEYVKYDKVSIAANAHRPLEELRLIVREAHPHFSPEELFNKVIFLPNFYPIGDDCSDSDSKVENEILDVGCFGAVRPMKNQLIQAVAAVQASIVLGKKLHFHVNGTRTEQGGENILKNLKALMEVTGNKLVIEPWLDHEAFTELLEKMDISMQVSLSETFNIVAADTVRANVPLVVSPAIPWASEWCQVDPNDSNAISNAVLLVLNWQFKELIRASNREGLEEVSAISEEQWLLYLHFLKHGRC